MDRHIDAPREVWRQVSDWRFLVALLALIVNDHWAKAAHPGLLTGKISDIAGLIVLPVILATLGRLCCQHRFAVEHLPLILSGGLLVLIKTSETGAVFVESTLHAVTRLDQAIVVDPTDLIGLGGLVVAHRVLTSPQPIAIGRPLRHAFFGLGLLACVATSYEEDPGWTNVEVQADGTVLATSGYDDYDSYRRPITSGDSGRTWTEVPRNSEEEASSDDAARNRDNPGPVCLRAEPRTCVRTIRHDKLTHIEESGDGGATWRSVWAVEPTATWVTEAYGYDGSISPGDVVVLDDDTVLVAAAHLEPIRRDSATGQWSPTLRQVRVLPWQYLLAAWAAALPLMGAVRLLRGQHLEAMIWLGGVVAAGGGALVAAADTVGPGIAVGTPLAAFVLILLASLALTRHSRSGPGQDLVPAVLVAAIALLGVVALPLAVFSQGFLTWTPVVFATVAATFVAPIAAGFVGGPPPRTTPKQLHQAAPPPSPGPPMLVGAGFGPPPPLAQHSVLPTQPQKDSSGQARALWALTPLAVLPVFVLAALANNVLPVSMQHGELLLVAVLTPLVSSVWIYNVAVRFGRHNHHLIIRSIIAGILLASSLPLLLIVGLPVVLLMLTLAIPEVVMSVGAPRSVEPPTTTARPKAIQQQEAAETDQERI